MKKHTINRQLGFVQLPIELTAQFDDQLKEQRKDSIVTDLMNAEQTAINDYEVTAFSFHQSTLNFDLFFHSNTILDNEKYYFSGSFIEYYDQMKTHFGTSTFPLFWNSLQIPFYNKKADWFDGEQQDKNHLLPNRFEPKSYEYNSFLKMNFYSSPNLETQELLFESVVFVNPRWCKDEGDLLGCWTRPTFNLNKLTDGYFLYWINDETFNEELVGNKFYVNFQFWNATNKQTTTFIPSDGTTPSKKWIQSSDFDYRNLFLECRINYDTKQFEFREFIQVGNIKTWLRTSNNWVLYELVFDNQYASLNPEIYVDNIECANIEQPITPPTASDFNINILSRDFSFGYNKIIVAENIRPIIYIPYGGGYSTYESPFPSFLGVRQELQKFININDGELEDTIKIKNEGLDEFYLKDVEISLINQETNGGVSTYINRIWQSYKNFDWENNKTTYTLSAIPNPTFNPSLYGNPSNLNFDTLYSITNISWSTQSYYDVFNNNVNWWQSSLNEDWWFPLSTSGKWNDKFAELFILEFNGNDNTKISSGEELDLKIKFRFMPDTTTVNDDPNRGAYSTIYLEPKFYLMSAGFGDVYQLSEGIKYRLHLKYQIKLYFNTLQNTLPYDANVKIINVDLNSKINYKHYA